MTIATQDLAQSLWDVGDDSNSNHLPITINTRNAIIIAVIISNRPDFKYVKTNCAYVISDSQNID